MSKQTAVEWLVSEYAKAFKISVNSVMGETIEKAIAMEKEQILEFTKNAVRKILDEDRTNPFNLEQYYNETYGDDK